MPEKWTGNRPEDLTEKYSSPDRYAREIVNGTSRPHEWGHLATLTAKERVDFIAKLGAVDEEGKQALFNVLEASIGAVTHQIRDVQDSGGVEWLSADKKAGLNAIRTGCSKTALNVLDSRLAEIGVSRDAVGDAVEASIRVSAEIVGKSLESENIPFDSSLVEVIGSMDGMAVAEKLSTAELATSESYGYEDLAKVSAVQTLAPEITRAGRIALMTANGAWNVVQPLRAVYEKANPGDELGKRDELSPQTGEGRINPDVAKQYGSFPKMIRSVYEMALEKSGDPQAAFAYAVFAVVKDLIEVGQVFKK